MSVDLLSSPLVYLKGVGPQRADWLRKELNLHTLWDLLYFFPFRYTDRSVYWTIADCLPGPAEIQLVGKIIAIKEVGVGHKKRLVGTFQDATGLMELVWFKGIQWVKSSLVLNEDVVLFGRISEFNHKKNMTHPEVERKEDHQKSPVKGLHPVYSSTEALTARNLHSRGIAKLIKSLMPLLEGKVPETLPMAWLSRWAWPSRESAIREMHFPTGLESLTAARNRLAFEELLLLQLGLKAQKSARKKTQRGWPFPVVGDYLNSFYKNILPFALTEAQKRVIKEIRTDVFDGSHMNRLLQGDVGSGKTIVAFMSMLLARDNGFQSCFMAPTEILAQQHFAHLTPFVEAMELRIALLTGSTKSAERQSILEGLADGTIDFAVGTHALIEDRVHFKNVGLAIIDEQHRFGVAQRAALWKKNKIPPHILVMTATPIPRTLAMSVYGDLDMSVLDELPPGRKSIETVHRTDANRLKVWGFLQKEIEKGRQVYIVYPLIEESETLDFKDLMDGFESIQRDFPSPKYEISILHGRMKPADKDYEMQRFVRGETHIMVATTVIEVGVNVPNASVMVIENAERFGLSQLHQLRGRVGRGSDQSYCILMTGYIQSDESRLRIETLCRTQDGFEIADVDLALRGPGDLLGTRQSGLLEFKVAQLSRDHQLVHLAKMSAEEVMAKDPLMQLPEHAPLRSAFTAYARGKFKWGIIS